MKKQILILSAIIISIFLINLVSSELSFWQVKEDRGNGTMLNRMVLTYSKGGFGIANDYVLANDPLETYLLYSVYVKKFNFDNPNFKVNYCTLKIQTDRVLGIDNVTIYEKNYTEIDSDIFNAQYFFQLYDGDQAIVEQTCHYFNQGFHELLLPAEMQMVMPTSSCKACQFYLFTKQEADIQKTQSVADNSVIISNYIKRLVLLNFEVIVALFWILLIISLFIGIGLIFIAVYWLYLYINHLAK